MGFVKNRKQAFSLQKRRRLPNTAVFRSALTSLVLFAHLAAACGGLAPESPSAPVATQTVETPTLAPTPTETAAPSIPEIFTYPALRKGGYTAGIEGQSAVLREKGGAEVLRTTERGTFLIQTQEGQQELSQESFAIRSTIAMGLENVLTFQDQEGNVQYFYLERRDVWATPLEIQSNPKEIEQYTEVELDDFWSGRVVISTALEAKPFPAGTVVPDDLAYMLYQGGAKGVKIQGFVNGNLDSHHREYWDTVNQANDFYLPVAFWRGTNQEGVEMIFGTEQVGLPNGRYVFWSSGHGPESSWVEGRQFLSGGRKVNIVDTQFGYRDPSFDPSVFLPMFYRPIITWDPDFSEYMGSHGNLQDVQAQSPGVFLYLNEPQNNPLSLRPDLPGLIAERVANPLGAVDYLAPVGDEAADLQYMVLIYSVTGGIFPSYFQTPNTNFQAP